MSGFARAMGAVLVVLAAAGCATPRQAGPAPHYKIGAPYKVNGEWYYPKLEPDYDRIGVASWYGEEFHNRRTANGEIFDKDALTAAHTTLPLPSMVEIENLDNGRRAVLRVNDRGPFARGRIIDVSKAAAQRLGFERQGTARVRVRYAGPAPLSAGRSAKGDRKPARREKPPRITAAAPAPPQSDIADILRTLEETPALTPGAEQAELADRPPAAPDPQSRTYYAIRIAALSRLDNIEAMRAELSAIGALRIARVETPADGVIYRITMGPFDDPHLAAERLEAVRKAGYADAALVAITP